MFNVLRFCELLKFIFLRLSSCMCATTFLNIRSPPYLSILEIDRKVSMRRKSKDNPYEIIVKNNVYMIKFKDSKNRINIIRVSEEIYNAFDRFELDDISQMHKYERHIEHKEMCESVLYYRMEHKELLVEEQVMKRIQRDRLYNAISKLPKTQQRRLIMYYFDDLSLKEIARVEECSIHSVFISIERAKKNLKKFLN